MDKSQFQDDEGFCLTIKQRGYDESCGPYELPCPVLRHVRVRAGVEEGFTAVRLRNVRRAAIRNCGRRIPDAIWNLKEKQPGFPGCRSFIFSDARPFNDRVVHKKSETSIKNNPLFAKTNRPFGGGFLFFENAYFANYEQEKHAYKK